MYTGKDMSYPTYQHAILALCVFFFSFYCFPFQIVFLYLKMKLLTMDTIVFDQRQTRPTVVSHLFAKDCV